MIEIAAETPLQEDVRRMVAELNDAMRPQTPPEFQFQMSAEDMAETDTTLFIARDDGAAVGMGALKTHSETLGEVKRMFTRPQVRGKGVGHAILKRIEQTAADKGIGRLVLETGEAPPFEAARKIYERNGYTECGPVLDYPDSGWSRFYQKKLERIGEKCMRFSDKNTRQNEGKGRFS